MQLCQLLFTSSKQKKQQQKKKSGVTFMKKALSVELPKNNKAASQYDVFMGYMDAVYLPILSPSTSDPRVIFRCVRS